MRIKYQELQVGDIVKYVACGTGHHIMQVFSINGENTVSGFEVTLDCPSKYGECDIEITNIGMADCYELIERDGVLL